MGKMKKEIEEREEKKIGKRELILIIRIDGIGEG